jgi:hypothetical protein
MGYAPTPSKPERQPDLNLKANLCIHSAEGIDHPACLLLNKLCVFQSTIYHDVNCYAPEDYPFENLPMHKPLPECQRET